MCAFVVFEGLDGAGKSTQIPLLADNLRKAGVSVETVREPGGTEAGERIRSIMFGPDACRLEPLTWAFLMNSARAELVATRIRPALLAGVTVLADRYWYSTLAYQGGGDGLDGRLIRRLSEAATAGLQPDVVIYLDLPPGKVASRKHRDDPNVLDSRPLSFHRRVAMAYQKLLDQSDTWLRFDADQSPEALARAIHGAVDTRLCGAPAVLTS